jgi:hypothetical protein
MTLPTLPIAFVEALRSAGATEEMIVAAEKAYGEFGDSPPSRGGRPCKHADRAAKHRAYRERKKARDETPAAEASRDETGDETSARMARAIAETIVAAVPRDETRNETPAVEASRDETRDETDLYARSMAHLRERLDLVAGGSFDPNADVSPIAALLDQGCDLEGDILPIVARELPELGRVGPR